MKNLFLLLVVAFSLNAIGQKTHKAVSGNPVSSNKYIDYQSNDSAIYSTTIYSYNSQQKIEKEITTYDASSDVDSIITNYDLNNRIVSTLSLRNNVLFYSKTWNYDVPNKRIDYYEKALLGSSGMLDTLSHVIYKGVRDFDNVEESFSNLLSFMETSIELRNCDTILIYNYDTITHTPSLVMKAIPYYQNGKPNPIVLEMNASLFSDYIAILSQSVGVPITINNNPVLTLLPTYNGDNLTKINSSLAVNIASPYLPSTPITVPDFIVQENKYDNNNFLIETKTEMNINVAAFSVEQYLGGNKQTYSYNFDGNISCVVLDTSEYGTSWDIVSKTYYQYTINYQDDIEIYSIKPSDNIPDKIGASINIEATLRNKKSVSTQPINITALIKNKQGVTLDSLTDIISPISSYSEITHLFTNAYIVPNIPEYTIIVYIDKQDSFPENDTIIVECTTTNVGIRDINSVNMTVSQNIPNPAGDVALFTYTIPTDGKVQFRVYSVSGQVLYTHTEEAKSGENKLELSVSNLASGMYFYSMEFNGQRIVKKMSVER